MKLYAVAFTILLTACAGTEIKTTDPTTGVTTTTIDLTQGTLEVATHDDILAAAKYASDHGYPERAAVRLAIDQILTAVEKQVSACANGVKGALDAAKPAADAKGGPITRAEMIEEAIGNFSGIPARIKILCAPIPIPKLPLPLKLP